VERYGRIDQLTAQLAEALERAFLINAGQPRVSRYIGGQDGGKLSRCGHGRRGGNKKTRFAHPFPGAFRWGPREYLYFPRLSLLLWKSGTGGIP
jgi:hypothetical protein